MTSSEIHVNDINNQTYYTISLKSRVKVKVSSILRMSAGFQS